MGDKEQLQHQSQRLFKHRGRRDHGGNSKDFEKGERQNPLGSQINVNIRRFFYNPSNFFPLPILCFYLRSPALICEPISLCFSVCFSLVD